MRRVSTAKERAKWCTVACLKLSLRALPRARCDPGRWRQSLVVEVLEVVEVLLEVAELVGGPSPLLAAMREGK